MLGSKTIEESKLNSAEMRMLRWARGKTWLGHFLRQEDNHSCAKSAKSLGLIRSFWEMEQRSTKKRWRDNITVYMNSPVFVLE